MHILRAAAPSASRPRLLKCEPATRTCLRLPWTRVGHEHRLGPPCGWEWAPKHPRASSDPRHGAGAALRIQNPERKAPATRSRQPCAASTTSAVHPPPLSVTAWRITTTRSRMQAIYTAVSSYSDPAHAGLRTGTVGRRAKTAHALSKASEINQVSAY
jgi:hypothetical protein